MSSLRASLKVHVPALPKTSPFPTLVPYDPSSCSALVCRAMPALLIFLLIWALIIIVLKFVEALTSGSLSRYLQSRNVTLKFGYVSFYTTHFNHKIQAIALAHRNLLYYWFSAGVFLGLVGLILSIYLLTTNLYHASTPYLPSTDSVFRPYPRIPFFLHQPPWIPSLIWQRFLPNDHHHSSVVSRNLHSPDLHFAALSWRIVQWNRPQRSPSPQKSPPPNGDCSQRNEAFRREVDSSVWIPGWLSPQKERRPALKLSTTSRFMIPNFQNRSHPHSRPHRPTPHRRKLLAVPPPIGHPKSDMGAPNDSPVPEVIDAPKADAAFLTPLIPGVTVPYADALPMLISVLVAAVVHELGHALAAAAATGGGVSAVGAFIALVLPGAFVRLTGINDMPPLTQLRVYCAGAWHNAISAAVALAVVAAIPLISFPFFHTGSGALVVHVPPVSPLAGHIHPGDVVAAIGTSSIIDGGDSFRSAVHTLVDSPRSVGFCLPQRMLKTLSRGSSCCASPQSKSDAVECFRPLGLSAKPVCLETAALATRPICRSALDCRTTDARTNETSMRYGHHVTATIDERSSCVVPIFPKEKKQLVDVHIRSARTGEREVLFFAGYAEILGQSLTVSSYVPRAFAFLPKFFLSFLAIVDVPNNAERLLQYFASISLGLSILNMAPVIHLDGEASVGLFVRVLFKRIARKRVDKIRTVILTAGSILLALNLVISLRSMRGR